MKNEYGKIKDEHDSVTCNIQNCFKYVDLKRLEGECPEGYYPIQKATNKPIPTGDEILWFTYTLENGVLKKDYFCRKPARIFSKFKIYLQLEPLGLYDEFENWLKSITTPSGINGYRAYTIANELSEENSIFYSLLDQAIEHLGFTKAEAEKILEKCIA